MVGTSPVKTPNTPIDTAPIAVSTVRFTRSEMNPTGAGLAGPGHAYARWLAVAHRNLFRRATYLGQGSERRFVGQAGSRHRVGEQARHPDAAADGDAPENGVTAAVGQSADAAGED